LEIIFINFLTVLVASFAVSGIGAATANLFRVRISSHFYLPLGLALILAVGYVSYKVNLPWSITPILLGVILFSGAKTLRLRRLDLFEARSRAAETIPLLFRGAVYPALSSIAVSLTVFFQILKTKGYVPLFSSFDTTSGDMFSYLILSEGLRNVGWEGQLNHVEVGAFDSGLGNLSQAFEHAGSGGYVLLAVFANVLNAKTWSIGTLVILLALQSTSFAASGLLQSFTKLSKSLSFLLGHLLFGSLAYLTVLGWWALNQIIFTYLLVLSIWIFTYISRSDKTVLPARLFILAGALVALSIEVYPSVAMYSLVPIFGIFTVHHLYRSISSGTKRHWVVLSGLIPLSYGFLGTFQFLPRIFQAQFDQSLDMGFDSFGFFDFLGLPNSVFVSIARPELTFMLSALNSSLLWGGLFLTFVSIRGFKNLGLFRRTYPLFLLVLGGSALLVYSSIIPSSSYLSHKLVLLWYPLVILGTIVITSQLSTKQRYEKTPYSIAGLVTLPIVIIANSLVTSSYFSESLETVEARQLHTITNEGLELAARIQSLNTVAVLTDFSNGNGWGALDRTILPAILTYPGKTIESGGSLAGYPYYSGWAVTNTAEMVASPSDGYVNDQYTLKFLCRLVCAERSLGISVFVAGLPTSPSEMDEYKNTTFTADEYGGPLSLRIQGRPGQTLKVEPTWAGDAASKCELVFPLSITLDATGRGRAPLAPAEYCQEPLQSVYISELN
jgi:hypothetical protein